ncbi:MAG: hypothetical protein ACRYFY_09185 [Janthinobacterium lividum]
MRFGFASLIPPELVVDSVDGSRDALVVTACSSVLTALCLLYGAASDRVQSHYICQPSICRGQSVAYDERFGMTVLAERARRTGRLKEIVHHLGLATGGRPDATFA